MAIVTCDELNSVVTEGKAVVVDVMTPEDFAACHIAGAKNACIYEVVFLSKVQEYVPDQDSSMVLYDASGSSKAAELASDRLTEAGYRNVAILEGGLRAWRAAGLPVEATEGEYLSQTQLQDGLYRVDVEKSSVEWTGRNLNNRHLGRISMISGNLLIRQGMPSEGNIILDMNSITNSDLQDAGWREVLINHLKSEDFFSVQRFPTASFTLTGWDAQDGGTLEAVSGLVTGQLTVKDVNRTVTFPATIAQQPDGGVKAYAMLDFDRTLWKVNYGSMKLFERLGMHLVHDCVTVELFVVGNR